MTFHVYILQSQTTTRFYVGHTENLAKRILEHNNNRTPSTKDRGPWVMIYSEPHKTRPEAVQRERQIKAMKSHRWIEQLAARASR
jgi:putative endonuclease